MTFSLRSMARERALWLLLASVVVFFWRPLTTETFFFRDIYLLFYGKKVLLAEAIRSGVIPLWDTTTNGGQPFLASPANSPFYFSNLLFLILPAVAALNLHIVLQFVLCAAGAYFLARALGISSVGAFATGAVYAFCGFVLSSANLLVLMQALPWAPVLLAAVHLFLVERRKRWFVLGAVAGAMMLLAGAAEMTAMSFLIAIAWTLVVPAAGTVVRRTTLIASMIAFSVLLSLVQTLPALEMIRASRRGHTLAYESFAQWSVSPVRLGELVIPSFLGPTDSLSVHDYWGARLEFGFPYIMSIYYGVPVLLLALTGLFGPAPPSRLRWTLAIIALVGVIFSMGGYLPFFRFIHAHVPLVTTFRFPVKALQLGLIPIAVLAGCGVEQIRTGRRSVAAIVVAACASLATTVFFVFSSLRASLTQVLFDRVLSPASDRELTNSFLQVAVISLLFALLVVMRRRRDVTSLVAGLVLIDLALAGARVNTYAPREVYDEPALAGKVRTVLNGGRLYRAYQNPLQKLRFPGPESYWRAWSDYRILSRYTAATFGIPVVFHDDYDGLAPLRITLMNRALKEMPWVNRMNVLSASGVTAVLSPDELRFPRMTHVSTLNTDDGGQLYLYRNDNAGPVRFATEAVVVPEDGAAFRQLAGTPFDRDRVILSENPPWSGKGCVEAPRSARMVRDGPNRWTVNVEARCDGFLVVAETHYPGWNVYVNGRKSRAIRADVAFTAVPLRAGRWRVEGRYEPRLPVAGFAGTLIAALVLGLVPRRWLAEHPSVA